MVPMPCPNAGFPGGWGRVRETPADVGCTSRRGLEDSPPATRSRPDDVLDRAIDPANEESVMIRSGWLWVAVALAAVAAPARGQTGYPMVSRVEPAAVQ